MAQSNEQPMQIEHRRSPRANGAADGAAEEADSTSAGPSPRAVHRAAGPDAGPVAMEQSKAPVPTSLMLFQSLVALRPEYLGIRLAEREANLAEMRRMHEQAREDTQIVPIREQQGGKQEEMETKRRRLLKQQSSGIQLWEAERDDMAAEQQSLRYHGSGWLEPSDAGPTEQDARQLAALRSALRSHFCQQCEVAGDASAQQLELRILRHKYIIVLSNMIQRWFPKIAAWSARPKLSQHSASERSRCYARMASAVHKLSTGESVTDERAKFVVQVLRYIPAFESVSQPDIQFDARLLQIRRVLYSVVVGKYAQFLTTLPEPARDPRSHAVQLGEYAKLVMGISILVEVAGAPANLLKLEKDLFIIGRDIERLLSSDRSDDSSVEKIVTLLQQLPFGWASLLPRWEVVCQSPEQQSTSPILC